MTKARLAVGAAALVLAPACFAGELSSVGRLAQGEFRRLSEDLGAAFSYKGVAPATPLGLTGFDIGLVVTSTGMETPSALARAGAGSKSDLVVPKLHVHKGLWAGFDIGAFVGGASGVDATLYGAELRYALLADSIAAPAVGLRLSGSRTSGTGDLSLATAALDVVVSKRFALATPYLGGGAVRVQSSVRGASLAEERFNKGRYFAGLNLNLVAANLAFEAERTGPNTSLSAKLGFRF